ncbi:HPr family phosphocarrier protein [Hespellia stercorisuis]|uniref:PTS HPr component phosphorylation site n=1 Tax=Hespellia stercorisuis DSM 15480 TaxID=1121950 RepID=A0A1M6MHQ5_9FIRM|nr:HPr family phosphocarrier protein [Hespellia stercorisuis]SHJ82974.1 PTS HPr component phosphorylation site [Hespellia stercorisuis DSM 15480]
MIEIKIRLDSVEDVNDFVGLVARYDTDFDLISGRYIVNAKSVMGIFSMDLSKPVELKIAEESGEILKELSRFIVE